MGGALLKFHALLKGDLGKIRRQRGAPQSAAILRAKLGGRRGGRKDEKFENHAGIR